MNYLTLRTKDLNEEDANSLTILVHYLFKGDYKMASKFCPHCKHGVLHLTNFLKFWKPNTYICDECDAEFSILKNKKVKEIRPNSFYTAVYGLEF